MIKFTGLLLMVLVSSCNEQFPWESFKKCIESAPAIMDYPAQLESLGKSHHAIGNYQKRGLKSYEWNTYVYFGSRYAIEFSIDVELNKDHTKLIKLLGEPNFNLLVYSKITKNKGGGMEAHIASSISFGNKEWKEIIKHKKDLEKMLALLKIQENKEPLALFNEFREGYRPSPNQRIKLGPAGAFEQKLTVSP
jgi:hypothetical protein